MVIDSILISVVGGCAVYLLQSEASLCNAKMDMVSHHFDESMYRNQIKQWFSPVLSWTNKYPDNVATWRMLAATRLPKPLFWVVNKFKPGYDPFSDFWHYQKFLWLLLEFCISIVWASSIWISSLFHRSFLAFVIGMALCASAWAAGWLLTFDKNRKKLRYKDGNA